VTARDLYLRNFVSGMLKVACHCALCTTVAIPSSFHGLSDFEIRRTSSISVVDDCCAC
jgi:hypothetical protein